jgi:hypothetical protein
VLIGVSSGKGAQNKPNGPRTRAPPACLVSLHLRGYCGKRPAFLDSRSLQPRSRHDRFQAEGPCFAPPNRPADRGRRMLQGSATSADDARGERLAALPALRSPLTFDLWRRPACAFGLETRCCATAAAGTMQVRLMDGTSRSAAARC